MAWANYTRARRPSRWRPLHDEPTLTTAVVVALRERLARLRGRSEVVVVPVDAGHVAEARRAFRRFGKGRHAAGLNFGDVFAYALSRVAGEPLLFKGEDFAKTDVSRGL